MLQDLSFGFRMLPRSPGFALLAILCLPLGIGATTSVFSWIEGILLRPFPAVADQERMMAIAGPAGASLAWPSISRPAIRVRQELDHASIEKHHSWLP
jgi:hypothetical protein